MTVRLFSVAAASALSLASAAHAAPDWTGRWVLADSFQDKQDGTTLTGPGRIDPSRAAPQGEQPVFTPEYQARHDAKVKAMAEAEAAGRYLDVAGAQCHPLGMPRFWFGPYTFEILYNPKQLNIFQEAWEQTRRIYLDGRKHPSLDDAEPLYQGHSVGRWEGDVLVIDTVNVNEATKIGGFDDHSDAMHVVERMRQTGPDLLEVKMVIQDAKALAKPFTQTLRLRRKPEMEVTDYICSENNRNPVDQDGAAGFVLKRD